MPKQKFEVELDVPEGYEIDRYAVAGAGDTVIRVMASTGERLAVRVYPGYSVNPQPEFILRKVPQYRDPVLPADWGKPARFSDDGKTWVEAVLAGYCAFYADDRLRWLAVGESNCFKFCQIPE